MSTNDVQLDNGQCGQNLQIGSDKTASSSNQPTFLLFGDGPQSSYEAKIDGVSIGTFKANSYSNVCIKTPTPLTDGPHKLTVQELTPHQGPTPDLAFSVDTVLPDTPPAPTLATWSDSPPVGDNITKFRQLAFQGTAKNAVSVVIYSGYRGYGGSGINPDGTWTLATPPLDDGVYDFYVITVDRAGNRSKPSPTTRVVVSQTGQPPATAPGAPTLSASSRSVSLSWTAPTSDGGSPITGYRVYRDGTKVADIAATATSFIDAASTPGALYAVSAFNTAGEGLKSNSV